MAELELVVAIEDLFKVEVSDEDARALGTPNALCDYLASRIRDAGRTDWTVPRIQEAVRKTIVHIAEREDFTLDTPFAAILR